MPLNWEFATAGRIVFGPGSLAQAAPAAARAGTKALVLTGRDPERRRPLLAGLVAAGLPYVAETACGEPSVDDARALAAYGRNAGCDLVVAMGGGSVMDLAKAAAALLTNPGDPLDYLEVVGRGLPLAIRPAPCIAIPTTAGTGSEVTKNAVLVAPQHGVKASLRHPGLLPVLAIVDPDLTLGLPPGLTASTGMDALTQLLEAFISVKATVITDGLCREGLSLAILALARAYHHGNDLAARSAMAMASLLGGMALANAGLGVVHGLAGPVGGAFPVAHGAVCAALLPGAMRVNLRALQARAPDSPALAKLAEFGRLTGGATAQAGLDWLDRLNTELGTPTLASLGVPSERHGQLAAMARQSSSMQGNPLALTEDEVAEILAGA